MISNTKRPEFREKFVEITDEVFKGTVLYNSEEQASSFWDNYLILPVNAKCIALLMQHKSEEDLLDLQTNLSSLFLACLEKLEETDSNSKSDKIRRVNAISILTIVIRNLFAKKRFTHFNIISILTGLNKADVLFSRLMKAIQLLIENIEFRTFVLQLALVLSAGSDNVNQNGLNGYFITNDMSVTLFNILGEEGVNENDARDIMMLLGMLSNYNKYESRNPYLAYMQKCKQAKPLENIISIYTSLLTSLTSRYIALNDDEETLSKSIVTYMTSWFYSSAPAPPSEAENSEDLASLPSAQAALLLPLYDLINTNSYFINTLINVCTRIDEEEQKDEPKVTLLTSLFSFTSYVFQNNRNDRTNFYSRLLLIIILRLMEENAILNYMARDGSAATIRICRQRSPPLPVTKSKRSVFCAVLDNMLLFIKHNIRKKLDLISYRLAFSVMHRVLAFFSKHKIRLDYHWIELWPTLTSVLHFTTLRLEDLQVREEFISYLTSFIGIFNMCVTHGETFLSDTKSYDSLYYEIMRATTDFIKLSDYVNRRVKPRGSGGKDRSPTLTVHEFHNIKLICDHFKPALDEWQAAKNVKFPTPEQVMAIINENYATLDLKPVDKLDLYVSFSEIPSEMGFFRQLLRVTVIDYMIIH